MVEMRWVNVRRFADGGLSSSGPLEKVLQYRFIRPGLESLDPDLRWSEWIEVPYVPTW
jgi:hypothetical protein